MQVRKIRLTFPLVLSCLLTHVCNFKTQEHVSIQAGARPASTVEAGVGVISFRYFFFYDEDAVLEKKLVF